MRRTLLATSRLIVALGMAATLTACGGSGASSPPAGTAASSAPPASASGPSGTPVASTPPSSAPSSAASSGASPVAGACGSLTSAEILQYAGITVTGTKDIGGGCAYTSASGTHSAGKDVQYLAGKDGVIIGIIPVPTSPGTGTCPTRPVQGVPTTATVCNLPGPEFFAVFKAASSASVEINVFSSTTLTDAQIDGLISAAYGRL